MVLPPIVLGGALSVAIDAGDWEQGAVLGLGVLAALVAFVQWTSGKTLDALGLGCLVVTGAVWAYGSMAAGTTTAVFGLSIVGPLAVPQLSKHRGLAAFGLVAFVAAVGAARFLFHPAEGAADVVGFVIIPAGLTAIITGLMFPNKRFYDVVADLEDARDREAELAVARERIRFASDLHDIQGHTLHVVKLKVALAQKLLHTDIGRVEEELREVYALVGDTISQTKELAYAQRRLNLSVELENARNLFEAAGIGVLVNREPAEVEPAVGELLGQVLREVTTNILRHTTATQVQIALSQSGIVITNDGALGAALPVLRGLSTLGDRLADNGGELTVTQDRGTFRTTASFAHRRVRQQRRPLPGGSQR
ncbi:sensor histidine kinase [Nakamurella silvestris]|nr:sensor histidine kinase [Nakamurella silvestris]